MGKAFAYQVGEQQLPPSVSDEPAHTGPTGQYLGQRTLVIKIEYPLAPGSASQPASGPFPLLLFAPGFQKCASTYQHLLQTWASAGYVVAAVNFPRTECNLGTAADESDVVNQPQDMSYALSKLLRLSTQPGNVLSGLLNPNQVAAVGQSDGGDTVAALGANTWGQHLLYGYPLKAVAVLSGAAMIPAITPTFPGTYFSHGVPPMMFVQGSVDTVNPPSASRYLYQADRANARYYLDLIGADHMTPYAGTNPTERLVARVTLAFFDRYVLGQDGAQATMTKYGNVSGFCRLYSGSQLPPSTGLCPTQGELSGDGAAGFDKGRWPVRCPAIGLASGLPPLARSGPSRGPLVKSRRGPRIFLADRRPGVFLLFAPADRRWRRCSGSVSGSGGVRAVLAARAARPGRLETVQKILTGLRANSLRANSLAVTAVRRSLTAGSPCPKRARSPTMNVKAALRSSARPRVRLIAARLAQVCDPPLCLRWNFGARS
jgi:hypothetical protein